MFERFTNGARKVIATAPSAAAEAGEPKVTPADLLLRLATVGEGVGASVLSAYGVSASGLRTAVQRSSSRAGFTDEEIAALRTVGIDADEVFRRIEQAFGPDAFDAPPAVRPRRRGLVGGPFDRAARKVIELSLREAIALGHKRIGTEHLLLALLRNGVPGPMSTVLTAHGVTYDDAKRRVLAELRDAA